MKRNRRDLSKGISFNENNDFIGESFEASKETQILIEVENTCMILQLKLNYN